MLTSILTPSAFSFAGVFSSPVPTWETLLLRGICSRILLRIVELMIKGHNFIRTDDVKEVLPHIALAECDASRMRTCHRKGKGRRD